MLDRMLRDRILCGIRSSALQKQLLTMKDLSVDDAETMALSPEAADKDANKMAADASAVLNIRAQSTSTKEVPGRMWALWQHKAQQYCLPLE